MYPRNRMDWAYRTHTMHLHFALKFGDDQWSFNGPEVVIPAHDFVKDAEQNKNQLMKALTAEYGNPRIKPPLEPVGAKDYLHYLDKNLSLSKELIHYSEEACKFINERIEPEGLFVIHPCEISSNFLCEGCNLTIAEGRSKKIPADKLYFEGYNDIGIDSLVTRWKSNDGEIQKYTSPELELMIRNKDNIEKIQNESEDRWETLSTLGYRDAVYASAALYASAKRCLALDLRLNALFGPWCSNLSDFPLHVQHYWAALYFNAGPEKGWKGRLKTEGVESHDIIWKLDNNHDEHSGNANFNAHWRTATFRLLMHSGPWSKK